MFIDLGAADGNTFDSFLSNGYGPVKNCPHGGDWQAILVEAFFLWILIDFWYRPLEKVEGSGINGVSSTGYISSLYQKYPKDSWTMFALLPCSVDWSQIESS